LWMVQELCDLGTLTSCSERGLLRLERKLTSPANMAAVVPTLHDIATAMAFVHARGVIHADLSGRNVLLSSSESRPCGFVAKVGDFALSRYTYGQAFPTKVLGTITHMPPELIRLENPLLVPEADVWALGILSWEAFHCKCCYRGKSVPQIALAIFRNAPLAWSGDPPAEFLALARRCLSYEYTARPSFEVIAGEFESKFPEQLVPSGGVDMR